MNTQQTNKYILWFLVSKVKNKFMQTLAVSSIQTLITWERPLSWVNNIAGGTGFSKNFKYIIAYSSMIFLGKKSILILISIFNLGGT